MVADQETARPLLTPGEIMEFPDSDEIIFIAGRPPIRAKKVKYYDDPNFQCRVMPPPPLREARPYPYRPPPRPAEWHYLPAPVAASLPLSTVPEGFLPEKTSGPLDNSLVAEHELPDTFGKADDEPDRGTDSSRDFAL